MQKTDTLEDATCPDAGLYTGQLGEADIARLRDAVADVRTWLDMKLRSGRYAFGFVMELVWHNIHRRYNVHTIYDEIGWLEEGCDHRGITKPATPFTGKVLKGLWHKHHHQAAFIARNILEETTRPGAIEAILSPYYGHPTDEEWALIGHALSIGSYEKRASERRMTGEWIIYEPGAQGNYYLTLGRHEESDETLRARVEAYRVVDAALAAERRL